MKILRTKNGNCLIAENVVFIQKELEQTYREPNTFSIVATDVRGQTYCLVDKETDQDAEGKFKDILDYLTREGD